MEKPNPYFILNPYNMVIKGITFQVECTYNKKGAFYSDSSSPIDIVQFVALHGRNPKGMEDLIKAKDIFSGNKN